MPTVLPNEIVLCLAEFDSQAWRRDLTRVKAENHFSSNKAPFRTWDSSH
jgi:hypothetical protein